MNLFLLIFTFVFFMVEFRTLINPERSVRLGFELEIESEKDFPNYSKEQFIFFVENTVYFSLCLFGLFSDYWIYYLIIILLSFLRFKIVDKIVDEPEKYFKFSKTLNKIFITDAVLSILVLGGCIVDLCRGNL